jgi:hypothetical protein
MAEERKGYRADRQKDAKNKIQLLGKGNLYLRS